MALFYKNIRNISLIYDIQKNGEQNNERRITQRLKRRTNREIERVQKYGRNIGSCQKGRR